ncbi:MAG: hypothetical protein EOS65_02650 [Mesorhizobium sp.]|uniref:hypothetical protein n=1 Tax=Mesorhizobium sp. TaxID=1871066 RepID=UPI000FE95148|nr:hypothetical protein [Mesorhizobium sp.]RWF44294.1 MAG: hypothetical protein EOS65_02650 [Mesorhizobium sp.]
MSVWDAHYSALYGSPLAVDAVLVLEDTDGTTIELRAIDKTVPSAINFRGADVLDIKPSAMVRAVDLADVDPRALRGASVIFNGKTWTVRTHETVPAPTGEAYGQIRLIVSEEAE